MPTAVTDLIALQTDRLRVAIVPRFGAGIASLEARIHDRWLPLLRSTPDAANPRHFNDLGAFWMIPWCNRITDGRFTWRGRDNDLGTNWTDPDPAPRRSAIHGIANACRWDVADHTPDSLTCRLRWNAGARTPVALTWPWSFTVEVRYTLANDAALRADVTVTNDDATTMPLGLGLHPFIWRDPTGSTGDARLHAQTRGRMEARWLVPTGHVLDDGLTGALREGRPLADAGGDHTFDGFEGVARIDWDTLNVALELRCSDLFRRLHLFTRSPRDEWATDYAERHPFIAVEPVTQGADAFARDERGTALDREVIPLAPDERIRASITFGVV